MQNKYDKPTSEGKQKTETTNDCCLRKSIVRLTTDLGLICLRLLCDFNNIFSSRFQVCVCVWILLFALSARDAHSHEIHTFLFSKCLFVLYLAADAKTYVNVLVAPCKNGFSIFISFYSFLMCTFVGRPRGRITRRDAKTYKCCAENGPTLRFGHRLVLRAIWQNNLLANLTLAIGHTVRTARRRMSPRCAHTHTHSLNEQCTRYTHSMYRKCATEELNEWWPYADAKQIYVCFCVEWTHSSGWYTPMGLGQSSGVERSRYCARMGHTEHRGRGATIRTN